MLAINMNDVINTINSAKNQLIFFGVVVALAVIAFLMSFIRRRDFQAFGWYRIALAVVLLAWLALRG